MPGSDWSPRRFDIGDLHPHRNTPARSGPRDYHRHRAEFGEFGRGSEGSGEIETWEYKQPLGESRHLIVSPRDGQTTIEAPSNFPTAFTPGQRVLVAKQRTGAVVLGHPPAGDKNVSQNGTVSRSDPAPGVVEIRSMTPATIEAGTTDQATTITGVGFTAAIVATFTPVTDNGSGGYDPFLEITFASLVFVDSQTATVNVSASDSAPAAYLAIDFDPTAT